MKLVFVAVFALCTLSSVDRVDSSAYDKIVTHSRIRARLQGPNVCAMQQVMGTKKRKYFSTCRTWYKGSICGKKTMVVYECCPGYMKLEGMKGCPAVAPIDHVYGTLGLVKARTTQKYSALSKLREEIEGKGSFTMFSPSDEAWDLLDPEVLGALVSNVNIELYNALHYHMVNHRMLTKDLKNDMSITSMYNNQGLYINHYSNGIVTVNCARIIHGNQVATNGVVHVIDRVITNVVNTIQDALGVDDDLSSFSAVALASGVMEKLGQPGHFTLFAPTNDAFNNLEAGFLERIMGDNAVIAALVNYHLLNSVQCSEAIMAGSVHETAEGSTVEIGCDGDSLTVNGIKMVLKKDIVTTNGVIHLIDRVLIPDSAKEVMELVGESQSTFRDMVSELGLSAAMKPETEYTLLAPLNTAFSDEVMSLDQSLLKVILENHILKQKHKLSELYNGQLLETVAGKRIRVFIYRTAVCIENSCMVRGSKEGSNGALHLMRSLLKPAQTTIYKVLMADGRFNIFLSLMKSAGLTELLKQEGSYTVFAPTDEAFDGITERDITLLASDVNALRTILLYHFSNGVFINGGLEGGVTNLLKTIQGHNLQVLSGCDSDRVVIFDRADGETATTTPPHRADGKTATTTPPHRADGKTATTTPPHRADGKTATTTPPHRADGETATTTPPHRADGETATTTPPHRADGETATTTPPHGETLHPPADGETATTTPPHRADGETATTTPHIEPMETDSRWKDSHHYTPIDIEPHRADGETATTTPPHRADGKTATTTPPHRADGETATTTPPHRADGETATTTPPHRADGETATTTPPHRADGETATTTPHIEPMERQPPLHPHIEPMGDTTPPHRRWRDSHHYTPT
ncbi:periostin-like [Oncorhynchus keta]|uniref:periostin-like n=1 Tax=Oncorhynchus keta TaxID=8018 RepID=UPI00227CF960|nr:periostin-like [Oncorhynchus keta]